MVEIVSVGLICEFLYTTIEQKRWERKPRGPGISDVYLLLSRHGCSNKMGCTAIPLHLCFLTSVPLVYILLSFLWVLSFSTLTAEILSFKICLKRHLLCEAILDHFSQRDFFLTFRAIYSHFFITQISGVSSIWARQWKFAFICFFSSPHKALSLLWKWN